MSREFDCVLIDADQIVYSVGFAAKGEPISFVLQTIKNTLDKIQRQCNAKERKVFIKGKNNFRTEVAVTDVYKGTRLKEKPAFFHEMYQYMQDHHEAVEADGMEADDLVSYMLWNDFIKTGTPESCTLIVSSADKDLKNTPGWHHNPQTGEIQFYTLEQSNRHFWYQMLVGDKTDNIRGLPYLPYNECIRFNTGSVAYTKGVGKETAKKIMSTTSSSEEAEELVYELYLHWGLDSLYSERRVRDYITEQGQLLWITRELDKDSNPVRFSINEERYERSRERTEYAGTKDRSSTGFESETG